jgi:aspartyl-tRNA(Asn)/glutamyl-tRNA(Gln) amidotransferase subunit C
MSDVSNSEINVGHIASLARLNLTAEEQSKFQNQLDSILGMVKDLQKVDISSVPDAPVDPFLPTNVIREDSVRPSFSSKEAIANAPQKNDEYFIVPKIVE